MSQITLAVVPSVTPGDTHDALAALCAELASALSVPVRPYHPASYGGLISALEKDRVQFAWMPPMLLSLGDERVRLKPLLSAVRGERTDYRAALFVDAGSAIESLGQLRGKRVAWVDETSASGYFYPRLQLAAQGLDPDRLFGEQVFAGSHVEVVRAVIGGRVDVGATYAEAPLPGEPITRAGFCHVAPDHPMRVVAWTRPIPNDVIVGHGLLDADRHKAFTHAILELAEHDDGRRLLYGAFHAERFVPTPRKAMRQLWNLIALARSHGLLPHM